MQNDHLVLVAGKSSTGKSACLMDITNPEGVLYLNCESGKKLPFRSKFHEEIVTDPYQLYEAFDHVASTGNFHTIVVDSQTYLMDMFESEHVLKSANTMKAWSDYSQFWKRLMQQYVAKSPANVIFTAHTLDTLNESDMVMETQVPVKGALKNQGIESYFSTVISTKKMPIKKLKDYENDLLNITPEEEALGFKYVFQTMLTKETVNERIRSPLKMWTKNETYIDNNIQLVVDRLHEYYDN